MLVCCVAAAPVANISVVGTSWLQHGDIWDLQVYWNGSAGFEYCIKILSGSYNVTGRVSYSCMCATLQLGYYEQGGTNPGCRPLW